MSFKTPFIYRFYRLSTDFESRPLKIRRQSLRWFEETLLEIEEKKVVSEWLTPHLPLSNKLDLAKSGGRTAALRQALQKRIAIQEQKTGQALREDVEIYLYYEIHLKDSLALPTFMSDMLYTRMGRCPRIDESALIQEVEENALKMAADFPAVRALCQEDNASQWSALEEAARKKQEEAEIKLNQEGMLEGDLLASARTLLEELEEGKHQFTYQWLQQQLASSKHDVMSSTDSPVKKVRI